MSGPNVEDAQQRARELERLIQHVEAETRKGDFSRTRFLNVRELNGVAGAMRFALRYLMQAIRRASEGALICQSCKKEDVELAQSRVLEGWRCARCAVLVLDAEIMRLRAEIAAGVRPTVPAEGVTVRPLQERNPCPPNERQRPSARRKHA